MSEVIKYLNLFKTKDGNVFPGLCLYNSKEDAEYFGNMYANDHEGPVYKYLKTVPVTIPIGG